MEKTYLMETQGDRCSWTGSPGRRIQGKVWGKGLVRKSDFAHIIKSLVWRYRLHICNPRLGKRVCLLNNQPKLIIRLQANERLCLSEIRWTGPEVSSHLCMDACMLLGRAISLPIKCSYCYSHSISISNITRVGCGASGPCLQFGL